MTVTDRPTDIEAAEAVVDVLGAVLAESGIGAPGRMDAETLEDVRTAVADRLRARPEARRRRRLVRVVGHLDSAIACLGDDPLTGHLHGLRSMVLDRLGGRGPRP